MRACLAGIRNGREAGVAGGDKGREGQEVRTVSNKSPQEGPGALARSMMFTLHEIRAH